MNLEENRLKAMTFDYPESIPARVSLLPATWRKHRERLSAIVNQYPALFPDGARAESEFDAVKGTYAAGTHVDAWGCVWTNVAEGMEAIVTHHPVPTRADVHRLQPPTVDAGLPHGFMYLRLADLRGFEELMVDFAEEPPELQMLIDIVLEYNMGQLQKRLDGLNEPSLVSFGDDLGMQTTLPMGPQKWRKYLKPCYQKLYALCHEQGHSVYMHTDGHIVEIIPDLIECGVNVVNPQFRANGLDNLVAVCQGKVCVDLDLDRQMFPFASPAEIDAHVREAVERLYLPEGGLWLTAECGPEIPLENVEAICKALETCRHYRANGEL